MARIPTVTSNVRATTGRVNMSIPDPQPFAEAFGAAQGRGLKAVGQGMDALSQGLHDMHVARQEEELANRVAQFDFTQRELELRNEVPANGQGYSNRVREEFQAYVEEQAAGIEDDKVRDAFRQRMMATMPSLSKRATVYEFGVAAEFSSIEANRSLTTLDNRIRLEPDQFDDLLARGEHVIRARPDIPAVEKEKLVTAWRRNSASARFTGMLENATSMDDLDAIEAELRATDSPWPEALAPSELERVLNGVASARRTMYTAATSRANAALDILEDRADDPMVVIPPEELAAARELVEVSDNPQALARFARIERTQRIVSEYRNKTPAEMRAARDVVLDTGNALPVMQRREFGEAAARHGVSMEFLTRTAGAGLPSGPILPGLQNRGSGSGAVRSRPVSNEFAHTLSGVVRLLGDEYDVKIVSAGQPSKAELRARGIPESEWHLHRTGSHRHDTDGNGVAHTADVVLLRNGKPVLPGQDRALYEKFFEAAAPYFPGMGHYAWGIHVGGGGQSFWGPDTTAATADAGFAAAAARGRANGPGAAVTDEFMERALATPGVAALLNGQEATPGNVVAAYAKASTIYMREYLGRDPSDEELFMAHHLGREAAAELIEMREKGSPDAVAEYNKYVETYASSGPREGITASAYADQEVLNGMADAAERRLSSDPMMYAQTTGAFTMTPLDDEDGFRARGEEARQVADYYDIPLEDMRPFTQDEAATLGEMFKNGTADEVLNVLTEVQRMGGKVAEAAMRQLDDVHDVYAFAGGLGLNTGRADVAGDIVRGQKRLEENPSIRDGVGATNSDLNTAFMAVTGGALFQVAPKQREAVMDAALAHYIETHVARVGNAGFDSSAYQASVQAVLGGNEMAPAVDTVNGQPTVLPPGVTGNDLETALENMALQDWSLMSEAGMPPMYATGSVADPDHLADEARLHFIGGGKYRVSTSDGAFLVTGRPGQAGRFESFIFAPTQKDVLLVNQRAEEKARARDEEITGSMRAAPDRGQQVSDVLEARGDGVLTAEEQQALFDKYGAMWAYDDNGNFIGDQ
jgi:hypothetical protein